MNDMLLDRIPGLFYGINFLIFICVSLERGIRFLKRSSVIRNNLNAVDKTANDWPWWKYCVLILLVGYPVSVYSFHAFPNHSKTWVEILLAGCTTLIGGLALASRRGVGKR